MSFTILRGIASQTQHAHVSSGPHNHSKAVLTLRVNDKPAQIKLLDTPSIADGDQVSLVGKEKQGTFHATAIRNDTTGALYQVPNMPYLVMGALWTFLGLVMLMFFIGIIIIPIGLYNFYLAYQNIQAVSLLRAIR